jgi:ribose 5-phosphate isomerase A
VACASWGIATTELYQARPDWSFDGADEVDKAKRLIKGRGGALFSEKILMAASPEPYIVVDQTKLVDRLGTRHPIPVEVDPLATTYVINELAKYQEISQVKIRTGQGKDGPVITERGNIIVDLTCEIVPDGFHSSLKLLPGVLETGIFEGYKFELIVA